MPRPEINQEIVQRLLDYEPETGVFRWKVRAALCVQVGDVAGHTARNGRRFLKVLGWPFQEHRIAWLYVYGELPDSQIDHINGNPQDNRIANLRLASASENTRNRGPYRTNSSGFKGVTRHKGSGRWQAACWANGKQNFLGLHDTPEQASEAYVAFAKKHHGEFFHA